MQNWKIKAAAFAIFLVLLTIFNLRQSGNVVDPKQQEYEQWLERVQTSIAHPGEPDAELPSLVMTIVKPDGNDTILKLDAKSNSDQTLRILELAKEAEIFGRRNDVESISARHPGVSLQVKGRQKEFLTALRNSAWESNTPSQSLLKLFQVYTSSTAVLPALQESK